MALARSMALWWRFARARSWGLAGGTEILLLAADVVQDLLEWISLDRVWQWAPWRGGRLDLVSSNTCGDQQHRRTGAPSIGDCGGRRRGEAMAVCTQLFFGT